MSATTATVTAAGATGNQAAARRVLAPGTRIGRYLVLDEIAAGGMGAVYKAFDPELDRNVAVKVVSVDHADADAAQTASARLVREARALAQLSHPNVVAVYDVGTYGDDVFIAMALVDGQTLKQWCKQPRTHAELVEIFLAAGRGLAAAHEAGLVHRDFKPDNVLIGKDGRAQVVDFGIARAEALDDTPTTCEESAPPSTDSGSRSLDASSRSVLGRTSSRDPLTQAGALVGTPQYMSPEQFIGAQTDSRTDQFSFCVALYEALYGERPFSGRTIAKLKRHVVAGTLRAPKDGARVPAHLRKIVMRGLAVDPGDRYPSMPELLAELADDPRARRRLRLAIASALGLVAVAVAATAGHRAYERAHTIADCKAEAGALGRLWNAQRARRLGAAFEASGLAYAADTWQRVAPRLDAYAGAWRDARELVCRADKLERSLPAELAASARSCLDEHKRMIATLVGQWEAPGPAAIASAAQVSASLPDVGSCTDETALRLRPHASRVPALRRLSLDLRERLADAAALRWAHEAERALELAQAVLAAAARRHLPHLVIEARTSAAMSQMALGRTEDARTSFEQVFHEAGIAGDDREALFAATTLTYLTGHKLTDYDEAKRWHRLATMMIGRLRLPADDLLVARELYAIGMAHDAHGENEQALAAHEQALAIRERALGGEDLLIADSLVGVANAHYRRKRIDDAIPNYQRALAIRERVHGAWHPKVADALLGLGAVHYGKHEYEEALRVWQRALAIWEQTQGPNHPSVGMCLENLAAAYLEVGRFPEALAANQRALAIAEATFGPEHREVASPVIGISRVYLAQHRYFEAAEPLERALALRRDGMPEQRAEIEFLLAQALWESDADRPRARKLARAALETYRTLPPGIGAEPVAAIERWLTQRS